MFPEHSRKFLAQLTGFPHYSKFYAMAKGRFSRSYRRRSRAQKAARKAYVAGRRRGRRRRTRLALSIIPKSNVKRFRYCSDISIDPTLGAVATHVFRANNMTGPDYGGTGGPASDAHQPYGFDQVVGPMYNFYTVVGSKITCRFSLGQPGDSVQNAMMCGIYLKDDATAVTDMNLIRERGMSRWVNITNNQNKGMAKKFSAKRFFNITDIKDNSQLSGSADTGPQRNAYFHVWACSVAPNVNASNTVVNVMIEYIAVLHEPNQYVKS